MPRLADYSFGRIVVDGETETSDVIVLPSRVVRNWRRGDGHRLVLDDLAAVLDELPERLIVGTGAYGRLEPEPEALARLRARGVAVEACRRQRRFSATSSSIPRTRPPRSI